MTTPDLAEAGRIVRAACLRFDALAAACDELGYLLWCRDTVFPQAVDRYLAGIGARA